MGLISSVARPLIKPRAQIFTELLDHGAGILDTSVAKLRNAFPNEIALQKKLIAAMGDERSSTMNFLSPERYKELIARKPSLAGVYGFYSPMDRKIAFPPWSWAKGTTLGHEGQHDLQLRKLLAETGNPFGELPPIEDIRIGSTNPNPYKNQNFYYDAEVAKPGNPWPGYLGNFQEWNSAYSPGHTPYEVDASLSGIALLEKSGLNPEWHVPGREALLRLYRNIPAATKAKYIKNAAVASPFALGAPYLQGERRGTAQERI